MARRFRQLVMDITADAQEYLYFLSDLEFGIVTVRFSFGPCDSRLLLFELLVIAGFLLEQSQH